MNDFENEVRARKEHELEVLLSKHRDYGPTNIANAPGGALNGLRVRLHDKLARVNNLVDSGAEPEHEALIDTALDIANYGTIMALVLSGQWPGVETGSATKVFIEDDQLPPNDRNGSPLHVGARVVDSDGDCGTVVSLDDPHGQGRILVQHDSDTYGTLWREPSLIKRTHP